MAKRKKRRTVRRAGRRTAFQACMSRALKGKRGRGAQQRFARAAKSCSRRRR